MKTSYIFVFSAAISWIVVQSAANAIERSGVRLPPRRSANVNVEMDGDGFKNNEIEGAIWEYKILPAGVTGSRIEDSSRTVRGKLRIKGNAIYAVSDEAQVPEQEHRVGDVAFVRSQNTLQLRFDDHPSLKGRAVLKPGASRKEGGVFTGYFVDKSTKHSKFELRRGED